MKSVAKNFPEQPNCHNEKGVIVSGKQEYISRERPHTDQSNEGYEAAYFAGNMIRQKNREQ